MGTAPAQFMIKSTCIIGEHCMAIVDRLRMFFELYLFPARLTNFKRAVVHVYTQANISGKGRAKPRMRGVGAPPLGDAAPGARRSRRFRDMYHFQK